jgi:hypothetical protein
MEEEKAREDDALQTVEKPGRQPGRIPADDPEEEATEGHPTMETGDLPDTYNETRVVLLPVSPREVHAYWDVASDDLRRSRLGFDAESGPPHAVLRFHDVTGVSPEGSGGLASLDTSVELEAHSGYFHLCLPGRSYYADLGILNPAGQFASMARSNVVQMPFAEPAPKKVERTDPIGEKHARTEAVGAREAIGAMDAGEAIEAMAADAPISAAAGEQRLLEKSRTLLNLSAGECPENRVEMVPAGRFVEVGVKGAPPMAPSHGARLEPFVEDHVETGMVGGFVGDGWAPSERGGAWLPELEPVAGVLEVRTADSTLSDRPAVIEPMKSAARLPNIEPIAPVSVLELIRRKYIELHRLSGMIWLFFERPIQPPMEDIGPGSHIPFDEARTPDLTEISERRFVMGLSSVSVVKQ